MKLVAQIYAYATCFVSLFTFLFALPLGVHGFYKYLNPTTADGAPEIISKPFLLWREDFLMSISNSYLQSNPDDEGSEHKAINILRLPVPSDSTLQEIFNYQRDFQLSSFKHHLLGPVLQQLFLSVLSLLVYVFHWRWLKSVKSFQTSATS